MLACRDVMASCNGYSIIGLFDYSTILFVDATKFNLMGIENKVPPKPDTTFPHSLGSQAEDFPPKICQDGEDGR